MREGKVCHDRYWASGVCEDCAAKAVEKKPVVGESPGFSLIPESMVAGGRLWSGEVAAELVVEMAKRDALRVEHLVKMISLAPLVPTRFVIEPTLPSETDHFDQDAMGRFTSCATGHACFRPRVCRGNVWVHAPSLDETSPR